MLRSTHWWFNRIVRVVRYTYPTLKANIKAIYNYRILYEYETQRYIKLSSSNNIDVYSLPLIIALSFRLDTLGAYRIREYVMNRLTANPRSGILFLNVRTYECMNDSKYRHNWEFHSYRPFGKFPSCVHSSMATKIRCGHYLKSASSSGEPFSEQSSSHTSRVLIRKNLHLSSLHI